MAMDKEGSTEVTKLRSVVYWKDGPDGPYLTGKYLFEGEPKLPRVMHEDEYVIIKWIDESEVAENFPNIEGHSWNPSQISSSKIWDL
jgi:hypothetical protein